MKLIKGNTLETILKPRPGPSAEHGRLLATGSDGGTVRVWDARSEGSKGD